MRSFPRSDLTFLGAVPEGPRHFSPAYLREPKVLQALQTLIDAIPAQIALASQDWRILCTNGAWKGALEPAGHPEPLDVGRNFRSYLRGAQASGEADRYALERFEAFAAGAGAELQLALRSQNDGTGSRVSLRRLEFGGGRYNIVSRSSVTELFGPHWPHAKRQVGHLAMEEHLRQARQEERAKLARDLHDTASQHLISMNLALAKFRRTAPDSEAAEAAGELSACLSRFQSDLRGLTFLLHPPELTRYGLHAAARLLCEGFAKRTGLRIDVHVHGSEPSQISATDSAVYRILQEALSNAYRHADASWVGVRLRDTKNAVIVCVVDDGKALTRRIEPEPQLTSGVGLAGMFARVDELGGVLRIAARGGRPGVKIIARLPRGPAKARSRRAEPSLTPGAGEPDAPGRRRAAPLANLAPPH